MTVQVDSATADEPRLLDLVDKSALVNLLSSMSVVRLQIVESEGAVVAATDSTVLDAAAVASALQPLRDGGKPSTDSALSVSPIRLRHHLLGAVVAADPKEAKLTQSLAAIIQNWAQSNYELHSVVGELVWRYEELTVLYDASETIVSIMDLDQVSRRILEKAKDMLDVENGSLMLVDADDCLRIQDAIGLADGLVDSIRLRPGEEISGWVAKEGKPLLVEDIESHPLFKKRNKERYINRSLLSVPLKIKDRVIGVINVNNKRSGQVFNSGDLKLLSALASLAAISIENAHTYQNAITDRLTRLYNYGYFREELQRKTQLADEEGSMVSLLMFDIDHFKNFNDKNGHELANVALVRIANLCLENSRQKGDRIPDLVARYGGEEFMILLYGVERQNAYLTAERVRKAINETAFKGGENQPGGRVSISIGVATYPGDATDGDELVNAADKALYRAKKAGRNNVQMAGGD